MQISLKIILDPQYKKKNGSRSIVIRITKNRKSAFVPTGFSIHKEYFVEVDESTAIIIKNPKYKNVDPINRAIKNQYDLLVEHIDELRIAGMIHRMTAFDIKKSFLKRDKVFPTLNEFMRTKVEKLREANRNGYADLWNHAERFLSRSLEKEIRFEDLTLKVIKELETAHLRRNPDGINGLSAYLRVIRTAYYDYAKEYDIDLYKNPWSKYTIRKKRTRKRATNASVIKLFRDYPTTEGTMEHHAKQSYLLSFYLAGMNLIDLANLKVNQIYEGKIHYTRTKIDEELTIPVPPQALAILNEYMQGKEPNDYVLPILDKEKSIADNYRLYQSRRNTFNKRINRIFKNIGVVSDKNITFYSARHSWATIANEKNKPITAISQGLGHTSIKTTQIYLDELGDNVLDEINRDIIDLDD